MLETPMALSEKISRCLPAGEEVDALEQVVEHLEENFGIEHHNALFVRRVYAVDRLFTVSLIRWAMLLITTPVLPVVAMMSTALPRL